MNNIFFTADHHFGHKNILEYCDRPFSSVQHMDDSMIGLWNSTVRKHDTVFHLGDFTLGNFKVFSRYVSRLNGNIKIVPGNHDYRWIKKGEKAFSNSMLPVEILPPLVTVELEDVPCDIVVLCHYSMRVWDRSHYNSIHLYGHSHGKLLPAPNCMDVGVDVNEYKPVSLSKVLEHIAEQSKRLTFKFYCVLCDYLGQVSMREPYTDKLDIVCPNCHCVSSYHRPNPYYVESYGTTNLSCACRDGKITCLRHAGKA